jgi:hypothetical protein
MLADTPSLGGRRVCIPSRGSHPNAAIKGAKPPNIASGKVEDRAGSGGKFARPLDNTLPGVNN